MSDFDISKIDTLIHGKLRLGIVAYLASAEVATFNELKDQLKATQGNLSIQLRKLEEAGYIDLKREIKNRKTETTARLARAGRKAFADYVAAMANLVDGGK